MPLPLIIEIVPLKQPVRAEMTVPGSKSITNRALVLAALANGETVLKGALWSDDTEVMTQALEKLGFQVRVDPDPAETCNRTISVHGLGGRIPNRGTAAAPVDLFVGNAGTAARFLAALVCLGQGVYRVHGIPRMHERPQAALFDALTELGYKVESAAGKLPAIIYGQGALKGICRVSIEQSSQFASALLLAGSRAGWHVEITGENRNESPYVKLTAELVRAFPAEGGVFQIEPDASSASYFWAAGHLLSRPARSGAAPQSSVGLRTTPQSPWQIDAAFPRYLPLPRQVSRLRDLGDSIMTAMCWRHFPRGPCLHRPRPAAGPGVRARPGPAHRVDQVRREGGRAGRYADRFPLARGSTARRSRPTTTIAWRCASQFWD